MAKEEGYAAFEAFWSELMGSEASEENFAKCTPSYLKAWKRVERTIANEALRRAAEVAEMDAKVLKHEMGQAKPDEHSHYLWALQQATSLATAIRALIKEPGRECRDV